MNIFLLERYINKITRNDIYNYLKKEGIDISNQELNILYTHLKKDYKVFISNPNYILNNLKEELSNDNYIKLLELYNKYKYLLEKYFK